MSTISKFEEKLRAGDQQSIETAERNWDERADTFYYNQVNGSTYYPDAVANLLEEKGILSATSRVLDIGAGSGRYAIPFAKRCKSVHALDLSSEMLRFLEQEMEKNNLDNIHTIKSAWPATEKVEECDIAFAAMCPATRSVEALEEMSKSARRHGVIGQFVKSTDNVVESLKKHGLIEISQHDPHNDRDILQAYFNILWELGYDPEISYLHDIFEMKMTVNEAMDSYKKRYDYIDSDQLKQVLESMQQREEIEIAKRTSLAVLSWDTSL